MPSLSAPPVLFGDALARARASWVRESARRLDQRGYQDYRRSDALATRVLARGPIALSSVVDALGVSRQAGRKVVEALVCRGFAEVTDDPRDARRRVVSLTDTGRAYALAVRRVLGELQEEMVAANSDDELRVATAVLVRVALHFTP